MILPRSLRSIVILVVVLALLPALALIGYNTVVQSNEVLIDATKKATLTVNNVANYQQQVISRTRLLLMTLGHLEEIQKANGKACSIIFENIKNNFAAFEDIRICNVEGYTIASASPKPQQLAAEQQMQLSRGLDTPVFLVHPVTVSPTSGELVINCTYPVRVNKQTKYILIASIYVGVYQEDESSLEPGKSDMLEPGKDGMIVQFIDKHGTFAYTKALNEPLPINPQVINLIQSLPKDSGLLPLPEASQHLIAYKRLRLSSFDEPYLTATVTLDKVKVYSLMRDRVHKDLLLLLASAVSAIAITLLICRYAFIKPTRNLAGAAIKLKEGDLSARATDMPVTAEIQDLTVSFNSMAAAIENRSLELVRARDDADAASRAKSEFLANMSHEIRTPMNAILGMTYLAQRTALSGRQKSYVDKIESEAKVLLEVINDILDFSKIEAGKLSIEEIVFTIRHTLDKILVPMAREAYKKGLQWQVDIDPSVPDAVVGDPYHLTQILSNLLSNATKYTSQGTVSFACTTAPKPASYADYDEDDGHVTLIFTIADTGCGFTDEQMAAFFPAVEDESGALVSGAELNLTITKRLIRLMEGTIQVESRRNIGTTITVAIPYTLPAEKYVSEGDIPDRNALGTYRILTLQSIMQRYPLLNTMLTDIGIQHKTVDDLPALFAELENSTGAYHLIIIDSKHSMHEDTPSPKIIRSRITRGSTPAIILLIEGGRGAVTLQAEASKPDVLLYYPFDHSSLFNALQAALVQTNQLQPVSMVPSTPAAQRAEEKRDLQGIRILLVEDNMVNQQIAAEILSAANATVDLADNGKEALDVLQSGSIDTPVSYDVVLMDLQMPVMNGFEATAAIRKLSGFETIPIIAMSAHNQSEEWEQCAKVGMNDYVGKPIDVERLFEVLSRYTKS